MSILRRGLRVSLREAYGSLRRAARQVWMETTASGRLPRYAQGRRGLLLNIGCGHLAQEGWVNVDAYPSSRRVFYLDVTNGIPLEDGAVHHIHAEHFLEHLSIYDAQLFLRECHRILEPGGSARIIVPDAERYLSAYVQRDSAFFEKLAGLGGATPPLRTPAEVCNQMFRMGGDHLFAWDLETLEHHARQAGFSRVTRSEQHAVDARLDIDGADWWRPLESLYATLHK